MPRRRQPPPYEIEPFGLVEPSTQATMRKIVTWMGLPDQCWLAACRRARRCSDPKTVTFPDCFWRHRASVRAVTEEAARRAKEREGMAAALPSGGAVGRRPGRRPPLPLGRGAAEFPAALRAGTGGGP